MRIVWSVLLLLLFVQDYSGPAQLTLPRDVRVSAVAVDLVPGRPRQRRIGALTYIGGVHLRESGTGIGGYSALLVDGNRFTLLSDSGNLLGFELTLPATLKRPWVAALAKGPGRGWSKVERDTESLTRDPDTGATWIGYENAAQIWRYSAGFARATGSAEPRAMAGWPSNGGAEAMARMPSGEFIVLAERGGPRGRRGARHGLRFTGDPVDRPDGGEDFVYLPPEGYSPVDAAALPDGRLLVLNRAFAPPFRFTSKLTLIAAGAIRPGAVVRGRELATLAPPTLHDNFEGMAVTREGGATMLWLVSDDNQMFLQRTLLLKFRLDA